jgi:hypothetical protein
MANISIIVEGEEDIRFLQDFIQFHFGRKVERDSFIDIGGKTEKLFQAKTSIQSSTSRANTNILIFDADDRDYDSTLKKIRAEGNELSLTINSIFLLPNNESKGNLETLLRGCIIPKNKELLECIRGYELCKKSIGLANSREIDEKEELYIYHGSFDGVGKAIASKRSYLIDNIWDLDSSDATNLKEYLRQFFKDA